MLTSFLKRFLGSCVRLGLARTSPTIVAITGTVGKSSTKQMLAAMLGAAYPQETLCITKKNYNNEIGVPLTVLDLPAPGRSFFSWMQLLTRAWAFRVGLMPLKKTLLVLEMGADRPGDLAYLTSIAPPSISVITAVTPEDPSWAPVHAANYPSIEALAQEKATLVRALSETGTMILNGDDARVLAMRSGRAAKVLTFGSTERANVQVVHTRLRMEKSEAGAFPTGLEVQLRIQDGFYTIFLADVFGRSAALAMAAAASVGLALGLEAQTMVRGLASYKALPGRTQLVRGIKHTMLFDDTYNASPVAVLLALRDLASCEVDETKQRKIVCLGEMRELGEQSETLHEMIGREAARLGMDELFVAGAGAEALARGAKLGGMHEASVHAMRDAEDMGIAVQDMLRTGDLVLAKASEGPGPRNANFGLVTGVRFERIIKELMAEPLRAEELLCRQGEGWV